MFAYGAGIFRFSDMKIQSCKFSFLLLYGMSGIDMFIFGFDKKQFAPILTVHYYLFPGSPGFQELCPGDMMDTSFDFFLIQWILMPMSILVCLIFVPCDKTPCWTEISSISLYLLSRNNTTGLE